MLKKLKHPSHYYWWKWKQNSSVKCYYRFFSKRQRPTSAESSRVLAGDIRGRKKTNS